MEPAEKAFYTFLAITAAVGLSILGAAVRTDGAVDYCWIESGSQAGVPRALFYLRGHRPWRTDAMIGIFETIDDAVSGAGKISCPLRK